MKSTTLWCSQYVMKDLMGWRSLVKFCYALEHGHCWVMSCCEQFQIPFFSSYLKPKPNDSSVLKNFVVLLQLTGQRRDQRIFCCFFPLWEDKFLNITFCHKSNFWLLKKQKTNLLAFAKMGDSWLTNKMFGLNNE